jgi:hypothetical protein
MTDASEIARLRKALGELHGLDGAHERSVPIRETFQGETVWEGVVEVFAVHGNLEVPYAYPSSHETDEGDRRYIVVLGKPPILGPRDAVRASIAAQLKRGN